MNFRPRVQAASSPKGDIRHSGVKGQHSLRVSLRLGGRVLEALSSPLQLQLHPRLWQRQGH